MSKTVVVFCPNCRQEFSIDPGTLGRQFQCVKCGQTFTATEPAASEIAPMEAGQAAALPPSYLGEPPPGRAELSRLSVVSLICGLLCWIWPISIAALVTGIIALTKTRNYQKRGGGMAIVGVVLGGIGLIADPVFYIMISIILPALGQARVAANSVRSQMNLRKIGVALITYENQNQGAYPPDLKTLVTAQSLPTNLFVYPASPDTPASSANLLESGGHLSYVYLGGKSGNVDPKRVVMYEAGAGHLQNHARGLNLLFADGHVSFQTKAVADRMIRLSQNPASDANQEQQ